MATFSYSDRLRQRDFGAGLSNLTRNEVRGRIWHASRTPAACCAGDRRRISAAVSGSIAPSSIRTRQRPQAPTPPHAACTRCSVVSRISRRDGPGAKGTQTSPLASTTRSTAARSLTRSIARASFSRPMDGASPPRWMVLYYQMTHLQLIGIQSNTHAPGHERLEITYHSCRSALDPGHIQPLSLSEGPTRRNCTKRRSPGIKKLEHRVFYRMNSPTGSTTTLTGCSRTCPDKYQF